MAYENDVNNLKATELRLGLPGIHDHGTDQQDYQAFSAVIIFSVVKNNKRSFQDKTSENGSKAQIVGWPPICSIRKNSFQARKKSETTTETDQSGTGIYVKVSMDGAPYLRKIDLSVYKGYSDLLKALENMFKFTLGDYSEREGYKGSEYEPTYEDKDGDWMLVGDVPWDMFKTSCKRLRIMKGSEARGLDRSSRNY